MVDLVSLENRDPFCISECKKKIPFRLSCWEDTAEQRYPVKATVNGLMFTIAFDKNTNHEYLSIRGSLHKFYNASTNGVLQNYNDFSYSHLCKAINMLEKYVILPSKCALKSMEIGLAINAGMVPNEFINMIKLFYKNTVTENKKFPNKGLQKLFDRDSYLFKIYNKTAESKKIICANKNYTELQDLVRFEFKLKDHDYCLNACGAETLEDLRKRETFSEMIDLFKEHWDNILMVNSIKASADWAEIDKSYFNKSMIEGFFGMEEFNHRQTRYAQYNKFIEFLDDKGYRSQYHRATEIIHEKLESLFH